MEGGLLTPKVGRRSHARYPVGCCSICFEACQKTHRGRSIVATALITNGVLSSYQCLKQHRHSDGSLRLTVTYEGVLLDTRPSNDPPRAALPSMRAMNKRISLATTSIEVDVDARIIGGEQCSEGRWRHTGSDGRHPAGATI